MDKILSDFTKSVRRIVTPENGDKDVFVHASQLDNVGGTLQEGQAVMFDSVRGKKGAEAQNVEMV